MGQGLSQARAAALVADTWFTPDPVTTARPVTNLPHLFTSLRRQGLQIAIATSDDRAPTLATLANIGVAQQVAFVVAADDGVPLKPAPDMVWAACQAAGVPPSQSVVVGDALPELYMARAAGAGLSVGVANGVSSAEDLAALADVVIPSVRNLID
jgi:phosphoglycolate phosphatase-like HAD superfamily hydrolase